MALALAPHGIRVNAVGPGSVATDMVSGLAGDPGSLHRLLSRTPLGRMAEPREIANVVLFLASDEASYVTGETFFADGGRLALNYTVPVRDDPVAG
jgi:glucose 1-dehydrogenase